MSEHQITTDVASWTMVPDALIEDHELSMSDRMVYIALRSFVTEKGARSAFPSMVTLAERTGCSKSTAKRAVRTLEQRGWVTVTRERRDDGLNHPNQYIMHHERVGSQRPQGGVTVNPGGGVTMSREEEPSFEEEPLKKNPPTPHTPPADLDAEWNEVWSWWPKHDGKHSSRKAYRFQLRTYGQSRVEIMQGIKSFADHFAETDQKPMYCPRLDSFLNEERWRDWADGPPKGHEPDDDGILTMDDLIAYENGEST